MKKDNRSVSIGRNLEIAQRYKQGNIDKEEKKEVINTDKMNNEVSTVRNTINQMKKIKSDEKRFRELNKKLYRQAQQDNEKVKVVPRGSYGDSKKILEQTGYSGADMDTSASNSRMAARYKR